MSYILLCLESLESKFLKYLMNRKENVCLTIIINIKSAVHFGVLKGSRKITFFREERYPKYEKKGRPCNVSFVICRPIHLFFLKEINLKKKTKHFKSQKKGYRFLFLFILRRFLILLSRILGIFFRKIDIFRVFIVRIHGYL